MITQWFAGKGWAPRAHQLAVLDSWNAGASALLIAPTGAGKTLAGFLPTLADLIAHPVAGLHTLYISPLKALAVDVARNLVTPIEEMGLPINVETRTGDTPASRRARQRTNPPQILLTTPEQIALLLSHPQAELLFGSVRRIVLDELHALVTSKRGELLSLAIARL
ncbi:MAG: helicase, partial [Devosia sp.]|nr:helicase [Devosia sp.]